MCLKINHFFCKVKSVSDSSGEKLYRSQSKMWQCAVAAVQKCAEVFPRKCAVYRSVQYAVITPSLPLRASAMPNGRRPQTLFSTPTNTAANGFYISSRYASLRSFELY